MRAITGAIFAVLLATGAAHGQALAPGRALVWPQEFSSAPFSCNAFAAARERYMRMSRPRFNCTAGIDCPQDLQPAPPQSLPFVVYYNWLDASQTNVDVTFGSASLETIKAVTETLVRDMDGVVRSKSRSILVVGHADTAGAAAQNARISQTLSTCLKNMVEVSIHLNGYAGAYDFPATLKARGESDLTRRTADGVREPLNRRGVVTINY